MDDTKFTVGYSDQEQKIIKFLGNYFDRTSKKLFLGELSGFTQETTDTLEPIIERLERHGLLHYSRVAQQIELFQGIVALAQKLENPTPPTTTAAVSPFPLEITDSLGKFRAAYPQPERAAFIMMRFGQTKHHAEIVQAIRDCLQKYEINGLCADDRQFHDDLFPNVQTYMHGCGFGIAVFERLEADDFNPNVSLEVGYMRALRKPVCLLKDKTLRYLATDLVGKLYKDFDTQSAETSIGPELEKWLRDKEIVTL